MSNVQPLLLLLASLFFLPALHRAQEFQKFEYCDKIHGHDYVNVTSMDPVSRSGSNDDPVLLISVDGYAKQSISAATLVYVTYTSARFGGIISESKLCYVVRHCNSADQIDAGTNFSLSIPNVTYVKNAKDLTYTLSMRDDSSREPIIQMCIKFIIPPFVPTLSSS